MKVLLFWLIRWGRMFFDLLNKSLSIAVTRRVRFIRTIQYAVFVFLSILEILLNASLAIDNMKFPLIPGEWKISQKAGYLPNATTLICETYHCDDAKSNGFFSIDIDNKGTEDDVLAALSGTVTTVTSDTCYTDSNGVVRDISMQEIKGTEIIPSIRNTDSSVNRVIKAFGNHIKIDHGDGYATIYAHLRCGSIKVVEKQKVITGELLGTIGNSGDSAGSHLHFQISYQNSSRNSLELQAVTVEGLRLTDYEEGKYYKSTNTLGLTTESLTLDNTNSVVSEGDKRKLTIQVTNNSDTDIALNKICIYSKVHNYVPLSGKVSDENLLKCVEHNNDVISPATQLGSTVEITVSNVPPLGIGDYIIYPKYSYTKGTMTLENQSGGKTISSFFHSDKESFVESPTINKKIEHNLSGGFNNSDYSWKIITKNDETVGEWRVPKDGIYEVKVFIPDNYKASTTYDVFGNDGTSKQVHIKQPITGQLMSLGTHSFSVNSNKNLISLSVGNNQPNFRVAYDKMLFIKVNELDSFPDIRRDDWFAPYAHEMKERHIIEGINGKFTNYDTTQTPPIPISMTKAEFLKMVLKLAYDVNSEQEKYTLLSGDSSSEISWGQSVLNDASRNNPNVINSLEDFKDHWIYHYMIIAIGKSLIPVRYFTGSDKATSITQKDFDPNAPITRYEAIKLLSLVLNFGETFPEPNDSVVSCVENNKEYCQPKTYLLELKTDDDFVRHESAWKNINVTCTDIVFSKAFYKGRYCPCPSHYNYLIISFFSDKKIMEGHSVNSASNLKTFNPEGLLIRAEAAKVLSIARTIYLNLKKSGTQ